MKLFSRPKLVNIFDAEDEGLLYQDRAVNQHVVAITALMHVGLGHQAVFHVRDKVLIPNLD